MSNGNETSQNKQTVTRPIDVVLDTSVLMNCLFSDRPQHTEAVQLAKYLGMLGSIAFVPAHAYFELVSAAACHKRVDGKPLTLGSFKKMLPFGWFVVAIDLAFVNEYLITPAAAGILIDLKGGDMIFVALALRHQLTLITEDVKMMRVARQVGVPAMRITEYLADKA